jgi:endonuclease/exonuclease/phosphatase family metal-dependent hydrolase
MTARYGRLKPLGGFVDAWAAAGHPEASGQSVVTRAARIDHCLVSTELHWTVRRAWIDTAATGSDHYPLWVEFAA